MKKLSIIMAVLFIGGILTGCSTDTITNSRTDKKLESIRQTKEGNVSEKSDKEKSYIVSKAELNSVNSYQKELQQSLGYYVDSDDTEDNQIKLTTGNDGERKELCDKLSDFQKKIIEEAENTGLTITFDGDLLNVVVPAGVAADISDYVNALCVSGGLIQRVAKGYAEWSVNVNVVDSNNERVTYQRVTNNQTF